MDEMVIIIEIANSNNGYILTKEVVNAGIRKEKIKDFLDNGTLVKIKRGLYRVSNHVTDEYFEFQLKCPVGIFSYGTALYFLNISNQVPNVISYTVPQGYNVGHIKTDSKVRFHYVKKEVLDVGVTIITSPQGGEINIYNSERTICDLIKDRKKVDMQLYTDALKGYFSGKSKNIRRLMKYANLFGIEEEMQMYMEVLL